MEIYATRSELENVVTDLKKLQFFLADTFGAKFLEFFGDENDSSRIAFPSSSSKIITEKTSIPPSTGKISSIINHCNVTPIVLPVAEKVNIDKIDDPLALNSEPTSLRSVVVAVSSIGCLDFPDPASERNVNATLPTQGQVACIEILDSDDEVEVKKVSQDKQNFRESKKQIISNIPTPGTVLPAPVSEAAEVVPVRISTNFAIVPPNSDSLNKRSLSLDEPLLPSKQMRNEPSSSTVVASTKENIQCDECQLFISSTQIEHHRRSHALYDAREMEKTSTLLSQPYKCLICQEKCSDIDKYEEHLALLHRNLSGKPCPICSKMLSKKSRLKRHLLTHDELKLCCKICGKGYNRSDNLVAHMRNTHGENEGIVYFYCSVCNNAFASREGRDKHFDTAHPDVARVTLNLPVPVTPNSKKTTRKIMEKEPIVTDALGGLESNQDSQSIVLGATGDPEKIKFERANMTAYEYEGDDD